MRQVPVLENIEEMRRLVGIEDVELREAIRGLRVGDLVRLTFLVGAARGETLLARITDVRDGAYRGKLAGMPAPAGLSGLHAGSAVVFAAAHIHSVATRRVAHAP